MKSLTKQLLRVLRWSLHRGSQARGEWKRYQFYKPAEPPRLDSGREVRDILPYYVSIRALYL